MRKNDGDGVQPVAEIVRDNAEGNQKAHLDAHLKADPDCYSVEKTVEGQARRGHRAKLGLMSLRQMRVFARAMHGGWAGAEIVK